MLNQFHNAAVAKELESYKTEFPIDHNQDRINEDMKRGLYQGNKSSLVIINRRGVWSSRGKNGSFTISYEKLGYHAGTYGFVSGIILSGVPILDFRKLEDYAFIAWINNWTLSEKECAIELIKKYS